MKKELLISFLIAGLLSMTGCDSAEETATEDDPTVVKELYPNAAAYSLTSEITGLINETPEHMEDTYKLSVSKAGTYTTYIELLTGTTDAGGHETILYAYDEYGTELLKIYDYGNLDIAGEWKRATFEALNAGNYYIRIVREYDSAAKYTLSVHPSVANGLVQDDNNERNDEKAMATPITLAEASAEINASINITDLTDSDDWYQLPLTAVGTYTTYIELLAGTTDAGGHETILYVYDEYGTELLKIYDYGNLDIAGEWKRATFEALNAGNYYIRIVREYDSAAKYTLSVHPSVANGLVQDDNNERNDEKAMATPITLAEASAEINASINITDLTDSDDWYQLPLTAVGTYTTYIELLAGTTDAGGHETILYVYDEYGTELLKIYDYGNLDIAGEWKRATFEALNAGNYYIRIVREYDSAAKYTLSVHPSVANGLVQDDNNERNDEKAMATPITLAEASAEINASINITDLTDSDDWYQLPLTAVGTYTTYIELLAGTTDAGGHETILYVYDEYGTELLKIYDYGNLDIAGEQKIETFEAANAGNYYINIVREYNSAAKYTFSITAP